MHSINLQGVVAIENIARNSYRFAILHRARQYHYRALCKIAKWFANEMGVMDGWDFTRFELNMRGFVGGGRGGGILCKQSHSLLRFVICGAVRFAFLTRQAVNTGWWKINIHVCYSLVKIAFAPVCACKNNRQIWCHNASTSRLHASQISCDDVTILSQKRPYLSDNGEMSDRWLFLAEFGVQDIK